MSLSALDPSPEFLKGQKATWIRLIALNSSVQFVNVALRYRRVGFIGRDTFP